MENYLTEEWLVSKGFKKVITENDEDDISEVGEEFYSFKFEKVGKYVDIELSTDDFKIFTLTNPDALIIINDCNRIESLYYGLNGVNL